MRHLVQTYDIDALRLDTAPYMQRSFLKDFRDAANVEIYGEVTGSNQSYLDAFLRDPVDGRRSVDGLYDFSIFGGLYHGFCGDGAGAASPETCAPPLATGPAKASGSGSGGSYGSGSGGSYGSGSGSGSNASYSERCGSRPDLRELGSAMRAKEDLAARPGPERLDNFANFVDTHDEARILTRCHRDSARALSAVVTMLLMRGVPVIFYGTEQGFEEYQGETDRRRALWVSGYSTVSPMYLAIAKVNALRKREGIAMAPMTLHHADATTIVFSRDGGRSGRGIWVLASNVPDADAHAPRQYCPMTLPPIPPQGWVWEDELTGEAAILADGCVRVADSRPKVLVLVHSRGKYFGF